jgi:predicted phage terminase large subunit-like protein
MTAAPAVAGAVKPLWKANSPPQRRFLETGAYEALYGGAAGGGKSDALLAAALRFVHIPTYSALLLRRTFPELRRTLIKKSRLLYPAAFPGAKYRKDEATWTFPSGATIEFGHAQTEEDVHQYQGAEFQFVGFDELTHFTEYQYKYLLSRLRSVMGPDGKGLIPVRVRASTNPGGPGHEWVMRRWAPWLWREPGTPEIPKWDGPRAQSGELLRYRLEENGTETWLDQPEEGAFGRVFIRALASDNPALPKEYRTSLNAQDALTRAQLRDGDWLARAAAGLLFKREWFSAQREPPADVVARIRYWDRASTEPHEKNRDPDWTVGVKLSRTSEGVYFVEDVVRVRARPLEVERLILATALGDGVKCAVGIEQDPGQAGVADAENYTRLLSGFNVRTFRPTGDKVTRAQPVSAQCEAKNVKLVAGSWHGAFLGVLEEFPDGAHDDDVDGLSGAFNAITPTVAGQKLSRRLAHFAGQS